MGTSVTKTLNKWGINPAKISLKRKKRNKSRGPASASPRQAHDCVSAEPQYAQVNKRKKACEDGVHYAEIQVLQQETSGEAAPHSTSHHSTVEYATIDFKTTATVVVTPTKSAELFIAPGELLRPHMKSTQKKKHPEEIY